MSFVKRFLKSVFSGAMTLVLTFGGILGLVGFTALIYGASQNAWDLARGTEYYIQQITRFFDANKVNPLLNSVGAFFNDSVRYFFDYPFMHLVILIIGVSCIFLVGKSYGLTKQLFKELFENLPKEETKACRKSNLVVLPNGSTMSRKDLFKDFKRNKKELDRIVTAQNDKIRKPV